MRPPLKVRNVGPPATSGDPNEMAEPVTRSRLRSHAYTTLNASATVCGSCSIFVLATSILNQLACGGPEAGAVWPPRGVGVRVFAIKPMPSLDQMSAPG